MEEELRLYKHRFNDNWHVEVTTPNNIWCPPDLRFWTKCLKIVKMDRLKAKKYFGNYLKEVGFEISDDYKRLIFGK